MQLYVLDRAKNTLATTASFYNDKHHKELTAGASIFEFTIDKSDSAAQYMTTGNYLVFLDDRGRAWSFTILSYDETQTTKTVAAEDVSIELLNKAMDVWNTDQAYPFSYYFDLVTKDTPWTLGVNQLTDLSRKLVYTGRDTGLGRLLSVLKGFDNAECQFNIKVQQNKPVEFTVDVYKSIGTVQDNIQIVYNNELNDIKKTESRAQFVTALAGIGGLVENQETTDPGLEKHIDFMDIDYKDDNFVSPKGDKFLRAVTANKTFNPGTTTYIEDFYDYDTQSAQELLNRTLTQLKERSEPQYTYDADVKIIDPTLDIGDTVAIIDHDYNPALYLQARVATLDKSYTDPTQGAITFCNYRVLNSNLSDQLRAMQNIIDQLPTSASIKVINNNIVQMIADNTELKKQVALSFESANGKSRVWFSKSATAQDGDIAFVKNSDGATEIWAFVEGVWALDTGLATFEDVKKAASAAADAGSQAVIAGQQASAAGADAKSAGDFAASAASQSTIETAAAQSAANSAVNQANLAVSQAGFANDAADQAKTAAANAQADAANALSGTSLAQQDATKALASAQAALTSVTAANDTANRADSSASAAQASAQAAIKSAQTALSMASGADAKAEATAKVATTADSNATDALSGANIALDSAATALNQARSAGSAATSTAIIAKSNQSAISTLATKASVNTLTSQVASTATLQKQTADELLSKADSSVVDSLTSTANSTSTLATQTATALKSKAEISTVNTVNSTATSAATLATQTATTLKSKADSTTVDKLTGRVSSAESKLTQTATKAELALTNTDVDKLNDTVASQGLDITATADALKLKADSSTVSDLTGTVADNSAQLALTATKAELALTQNDIDDLGDTVSNQGVKLAATATAVELAATQDNVDTLKKTVTNNTAGVTANAKQIALKANQTDVDTLKGTVTSQGAQVAVTASQVALKADTATVNNLGKTVASQGAQLSLTATEVDLEAAQSAVDAVTKTVTSNTAGMTANANALKLKADSSTVSTLDSRVTNLSGQLDVQANLISAKVTANDVTGMLNGYATQSWSEGKISAAKNEISASVETVNQRVNNLSVGGVNLLLGTDFNNMSPWIYRTGAVVDGLNGHKAFYLDATNRSENSTEMLQQDIYVPEKVNKTLNSKWYTLSFYLKGSGNTNSYVYSGFVDTSADSYIDGVALGYPNPDGSHAWGLTDDWIRHTYTFKSKAVFPTTGNQHVLFRLFKGNVAYISMPQLEAGTLVTDYNIAPEEQATQDWTKSLLDVSEGKVSAQVQSVKSDLTNATNVLNQNIANATAGMATQTWVNNKVSLTEGGLSADIQKLRTDTTDNIANATAGMATQTWTQSKLDLTADGLTSQISSVENGLDTKYTSLEETLKGVQITANNAVTQSQYTQLANQFTSTIANAGAPNLVSMSNWSNVKKVSHTYYKGSQPLYELANTNTTETTSGSLRFTLKRNTKYMLSFFGFASSNVSSADVWVLGRAKGETKDWTQAIQVFTAIRLPPGGDKYNFSAGFTTGNIDEAYVRFDNNGVTDGTSGSIYFTEVQIEEGTVATPYRISDNQLSSQITQLQSDINLRVKTGDLVSQIDVNAKRILLDGASTYITNTTHIDTGVIKTAMIADAAITNGKIADAAIDNAKIANASITAAKIAELAVGSAQIADGAISSAKIGNAAITSAKIADASILDAKIVNLDGSKIVAHSITADQLDVNAIAVGLNTYGTGWQITPMSIAWMPTGTTHASISLTGDMGITFGDLVTGETLGHMYGTPYNMNAGKDWFNGISTVLKYNGADYWSVLSEESDSTVRPRLTYSRNRIAELGVFQGWTFDDNTHFATIGPMDSDDKAQMKVVRLKIGDRWATGFKNSNGNAGLQSGIAFTDDGACYFGRAGAWWNLADILKNMGAPV